MLPQGLGHVPVIDPRVAGLRQADDLSAEAIGPAVRRPAPPIAMGQGGRPAPAERPEEPPGMPHREAQEDGGLATAQGAFPRASQDHEARCSSWVKVIVPPVIPPG